MKKILIGFLAMMLSNCAISQTSQTNEKITFSIPKQSERRTNEKDLPSGSFKGHGYIKHANLNKGLLYGVDRVKLYVEAADSPNKKDYLAVIRESLLSDNKRGILKWTLDEIKELNNFVYLKGTCRYPKDPFYYVTILAVNKSYTSQMVAYIEYDEKDKQAGDKVVQDFLKSVKFK